MASPPRSPPPLPPHTPTHSEVQRARLGHQPHRGPDGHVLPADPAHHPVQHPAVVAEARPEELAVLVLAEPVDVEHLGQLVLGVVLEGQPVLQVVAEVVAEEGPHGEGVVHHQLDCNTQ